MSSINDKEIINYRMEFITNEYSGIHMTIDIKNKINVDTHTLEMVTTSVLGDIDQSISTRKQQESEEIVTRMIKEQSSQNKNTQMMTNITLK